MPAEETHTTDTMDQVKKSIADGKAILIDVREKDEWAVGHLKAATSVPLSELKTATQAPANVPKDKPVYIHCKSGKRALMAAGILKTFGIDVRPLKAGYDDLKEQGFEKAN